MSDKNEVALFEKNNLVVFQKMRELKKQKDEIEKSEKQFREALEKSMSDYGIVQFKNEYVTISYTKESNSVTVDLEALNEKEPELYKDLLKDYPKATSRKASVRIQVK